MVTPQLGHLMRCLYPSGSDSIFAGGSKLISALQLGHLVYIVHLLKNYSFDIILLSRDKVNDRKGKFY